ncbi:hypothetical protein V8E54_010990 [Elaphomyces granulatus]|jgi:hypothetical protein
MTESNGRPKGRASKDIYTVKQFKLHAVLICQLWDLRSEDDVLYVTIAMISANFTSEMWKYIFHRCKAKLLMTTANHPSGNGQSEKNKRCALRCVLAGKYEADWNKLQFVARSGKKPEPATFHDYRGVAI